MQMAKPTRDALIAFRATAELKKQLEELAAAESRPLSNYLELVLRAHAASKRPKPRDVSEGKPPRR